MIGAAKPMFGVPASALRQMGPVRGPQISFFGGFGAPPILSQVPFATAFQSVGSLSTLVSVAQKAVRYSLLSRQAIGKVCSNIVAFFLAYTRNYDVVLAEIVEHRLTSRRAPTRRSAAAGARRFA